MKASTLFGLTFALLMGLGVVVAARVTGFLDTKPTSEPEQKKNGAPMLIAAKNLFRGTAALEYDAKVRPMTEQDHTLYDRYRDKMLAPIPSAVEYRILKVNVPAGVPLLEDMFEPQALPEQLSLNLAPQMRAVNVVLDKHRVAGGLPRKGEFVDVLLTATIRQNAGLSRDTAPMAPFTASAIIARKLKIVAKRDTPYTLNVPNPVDKPLSFILEANPYRSALIEYAKSRGYLTLELLAPTNLANEREPMVDPDSKEYRDEDKRVREFMNNEHTITDADLERIFNLRTRPMPIQPIAARPPEMFIGLTSYNVGYNAGWRSYSGGGGGFGNAPGTSADAGPTPTMQPIAQTSFSFGSLGGADFAATDLNNGEKKCATCGNGGNGASR
jgi:Flp pilus assembly protein CpaB